MKNTSYPPIYGRETSALPEIMGPLNIEQEGDSQPMNDMAEVAPDWSKGKASRDPLGVVVGSK